MLTAPTQTASMDEQRLLLEITQGSRSAFKQLYEQTSPLLYAVALKIVKKQDMAEEVLQEVYLTIWHAASQYNIERGSVRTWLSTITRNRCIDRLRRTPKESALDSHHENELVATTLDPLQCAENADDQNLLMLCLDRLDEKQRACVSLAFFEGMTHQEVAGHLTVPLGSAKTWIRRGLDVLKKCMEAL